MAAIQVVTCPICFNQRKQTLRPGQRLMMRCGWHKKTTTERRKRQLARNHQRKKLDPDYRRRRQKLHKEHRKNLRLEILKGYGGKCACCGDPNLEFLCIDHVNGGGNDDRRERGYASIMYQIKRENFPSTFRLLCHNCNQSRAYYKYCPHDLQRRHHKKVVLNEILRERDEMDEEDRQKR